ncbi:MAG TPA: neuromedin U, partial [Bacteroidia bacterium]|nr:neuromedin U [Bacteroidia bacterium]
LGDQALSQTLIQPVLPLALNKNWNLVSRTVVPVMSLPKYDGDRYKGIADIQEQIFLSPTKKTKVIWGAGPVFSLPTSTIEPLATGQFAAGPTVVFLAMPGKFVVGAVGNHLWRIAGSDSTTEINSLFVQPFINYNLKGGWAISTAPSITANWSADDDQQWTVPVGLGVSKITLIGKQALNISAQYYHNAVRPDNAGADQIRLAVGLLFPRS